MSAAIALASPRRIKASHRRRRKVASSRQHYNYFRDYDPATGRYNEPDPIGLRGGISMYGYVRGNPLAKIDPTGLVEFSGELYPRGFGGGFTISYQDGLLEVTGKVGIGYGGGLMLDPHGSPSPHAKKCRSGPIVRGVPIEAAAGLGLGPLTRQVGYKLAYGNIFEKYTQSPYGAYQEITPFETNIEPGVQSNGARADVSANIEFGFYKDIGGKGCECQK